MSGGERQDGGGEEKVDFLHLPMPAAALVAAFVLSLGACPGPRPEPERANAMPTAPSASASQAFPAARGAEQAGPHARRSPEPHPPRAILSGVDAPNPACDRQDPAVVREAARACLGEHAPVLGLALTALVARRSGATADDWVIIVRALLAPEPDDRLDDADEIIDLCLRRAHLDAPGHPEIERLRQEIMGPDQGTGSAYRSAAASVEANEIVERILAALDTVSPAPMPELLEVLPDHQDVAVAELGDEAEPRTATLVAALLRSGLTPALQCFLLDSIAAWASHPDVRDAVDELAGSGRRELLEPSLGQALATVTAARPGALRHRPSEGRRARARSSAHEGGGDTTSSKTRTVFSGTAHRWGNSIVLLGLVGLALASLIVCVLIAADWSANRASGLPVAWSGGIAVGLGLVAGIGARAARVRYRIVTTDDGARLEIDDGPRSTSLPFPLDYRASMEHVRIRIRGIPRHYFRLHLVVTGEGHAPIAFVEEREEPARGWADEPDRPLAYGAHKAYRCREIESLERELARWNQKGSAGSQL